jgi:transposase
MEAEVGGGDSVWRRFWTAEEKLCLHLSDRRGGPIKLLWHDGEEMCLFTKRLDRGRFVWPQARSGVVSLTRAQLSMLCERIDWRQAVRTWQPLMAI